MGNNSTSESGTSIPTVPIPNRLKISPYFTYLARLFQNLATIKDRTRIVTISKFKELFDGGDGKHATVIELLFKYFCATATSDVVCNDMIKVSFISGFDRLLKLECGSLDMAMFYIKMFSDGKLELAAQDITAILCGIHAVQFQKDDLTQSTARFEDLAKSLLCTGKDATNKEECANQMFQLWPRLFNSVHYWILRSLLKHGHSVDVTMLLERQMCTRIELLSLSDTRDILDPISLWILSTSIPTLYLKRSQESGKKDEDRLISEWRNLYDSNEHGLSHNRFKHHCFSYRGPTAMAILLGNNETLVLAVDVEWRESTKCFGDSATRLYQVNPQFKVLAEKNIVLFNEKTRGVPVGLTLGNNPGKPQVSLLDGLTSATLCYLGQETTVQRIQVWGCAGMKAETDQKQHQKWEKRQAEQLQKVKLPGAWDENPDKAILDMAGITTEHAHR